MTAAASSGTPSAGAEASGPATTGAGSIPGLDHIYSGKVRDLYRDRSGQLVMVASDRISAFDVIMAEPVPDKGRVLTGLSAYWFGRFASTVGSHLVSTSLDAIDLGDAGDTAALPDEWAGRTMVCRPAEMLPIECIVRGYLSGSAWAEYRRSGTIHGEAAPAGLIEADRLPEPRFTPSTKADEGHDENISRARAAELIGTELVDAAEAAALAIYRAAAARAEEVGLILADTKFEFGLIDGQLALCDEVITPDSSRMWEAELWSPGSTPVSYDKQPVRDYLASLDWDRTPPPPQLPDDVIDATRVRYRSAFERLTDSALPSATDLRAGWPDVES